MINDVRAAGFLLLPICPHWQTLPTLIFSEAVSQFLSSNYYVIKGIVQRNKYFFEGL
jgi:hypothetical protein